MLVDAWPLVGRFIELESCRRALAEDGVPVQLITGAAGVGKSRLMAEICRRLDDEREVLRCVTSPGTATGTAGRAGSSTCPKTRSALISAGDPARAFHRVLTAFRSRSSHRCCPSTTCTCSTPRRWPWCISWCLTVWCSCLPPSGLQAPVPEGVHVIRRLPGCRELELSPLDEDEVGALLHLQLGLPVDAGLGRQLWERSPGNPADPARGGAPSRPPRRHRRDERGAASYRTAADRRACRRVVPGPGAGMLACCHRNAGVARLRRISRAGTFGVNHRQRCSRGTGAGHARHRPAVTGQVRRIAGSSHPRGAAVGPDDRDWPAPRLAHAGRSGRGVGARFAATMRCG